MRLLNLLGAFNFLSDFSPVSYQDFKCPRSYTFVSIILPHMVEMIVTVQIK